MIDDSSSLLLSPPGSPVISRELIGDPSSQSPRCSRVPEGSGERYFHDPAACPVGNPLHLSEALVNKSPTGSGSPNLGKTGPDSAPNNFQPLAWQVLATIALGIWRLSEEIVPGYQVEGREHRATRTALKQSLLDPGWQLTSVEFRCPLALAEPHLSCTCMINEKQGTGSGSIP